MAHYCKWDDHCRNLLIEMENMKTAESYVDATIVCEGQSIKVHKLILSTCSTLFHNMFQSNPCSHPFIILQDIKFSTLQTIVNFMYRGEIAFESEEVEPLLKAAKALDIKGLNTISREMFFGSDETNMDEESQNNNSTNNCDFSPDSSPPRKRMKEGDDGTGLDSVSSSNLISNSLVQAEECVEFDPQISEICSFSESTASGVPPNQDPHNSTPENVSEEISTEKNTVSTPHLEQRNYKSFVWQYFTPINNFQSKCDICSVKTVFATSLSNLKRHLRLKHLSIYESHPLNEQICSPNESETIQDQQTTQTNLQESSDETSDETFTVRKRSLIWNYFTPISESSAQCKICLQNRHYGSTTSNLARHIRLKHPFVNAQIAKAKQNGGKIKPTIKLQVSKKKLAFPKPHVQLPLRDLSHTSTVSMAKKKSRIWNYFTPLDSSFAQCKTCLVRRFYGTTITNLKRHLKLKHPSLLDTTFEEQVHSEIQNSEEQNRVDEVQAAVDTVQNVMTEETAQENFDTVEGLKKDDTDEVESSMQEIQTGDGEKNNTPLMAKKTSYLWKFFTPLNKKTAVCKICKAIKPYQSTISNLKKHMLHAHPSVELPCSKQNSAQQSTKDGDSSATEEILTEVGEPQICEVDSQLLAIAGEAVQNQAGLQEVTLQIFDKVTAGTLHQLGGETLHEITLPTTVVQTECTQSRPFILKLV